VISPADHFYERTQAKAEAARQRIKDAVPGCRGPEIAVFDLADLESVRTWARRAQEFGLPLDVLVANAGVMACPETRTQQGFEYQLGVNHLGHFLLINMLLPLLKAAGNTTRNPGRVVTVASAAHFFGRIDLGDINFRQRTYDPWVAYGQSKLANVMFAFELARREPEIVSNSLHPGVVATELGRYLLPPGGEDNLPWWQRPLFTAAKAVALTPEQGARTSLYLASSPEAEVLTGLYFDSCRPTKSSAAARDVVVAQKLWDTSCELVGF
jgi:NAD(P)-dependent dehydrogenase (short-subunit alcohol dehydrogenase family)